MSYDPNEYVAQIFPSLISDLRRADVSAHEQQHLDEREALAELRAQQDAGLSTAELYQRMQGPTEAERQAKLDAQLDKEQQEVAAAVAAKETPADEPTDRFPPPPLRAG